MTRKRSLPTTGSILSSASTESIVSAENSLLDEFAGTLSGWMYWKRDAQCWMKVYVVLRKHFLWLLRSNSAASFSSPLIHMALTGVERTTLRSFLVTGPSHETMELHLYDEEEVWTWFDALVEAVNWTRMSMDERAQQQEQLKSKTSTSSRRSSIASVAMMHATSTTRASMSVDREYRGTLVVYNQERQGSRWRRFVRSKSQNLKQALLKKVEEIVDRFETVQTRPALLRN